ncbi:methyltransferase [Jannaschia pagri]|uniref:Methyltransferase n=1 Tax=Jannaschia pagri TaxID=2829797 RepID=A0ABQ4NHB4_9RHOB|nr:MULTISPECIES: methyltransferase [unclassified Jannaschia]GIT90076.1 methyltransferase [Jannaschia sp. AI_61]GIT93818.1 methyltransferase [Jannaschia sp. AI_62]
MTTTRDAFLGGRLHLYQPRDGFRSGSDAVLLAAAVPAQSGQRILDLGCGAGVAMYCLAARVPDLALTGVEREADLIPLAQRNGPAEVVQADVFALPDEVRARQWDHVLTNPPYFVAGAGSAATNQGREAGLREGALGDLARWVRLACKRVAPKGTMTVIARADRLGDILPEVAAALGRVRVLPIAAQPDTTAKRVIVQGTKNARAPLALLPPLILHRGDGGPGYGAQADQILREGATLSLA